jgi:hypothetical protein
MLLGALIAYRCSLNFSDKASRHLNRPMNKSEQKTRSQDMRTQTETEINCKLGRHTPTLLRGNIILQPFVVYPIKVVEQLRPTSGYLLYVVHARMTTL